MRVVIAEDSVLLREGVARLLEEAGIEVVGQAGDAEDLLRKVRAHKPDVAIVDIRMPPDNADEGLRAALDDPRASCRTSACSCSRSTSRSATSMQLLDDGAEGVGYLLKDRDRRRRPRSSTRSAASPTGGSALDPEVVAQMLGRRARDGPLDSLTAARARGARADGRGPDEPRRSPSELVVTERAVERHVTAIFEKLGLPTGDGGPPPRARGARLPRTKTEAARAAARRTRPRPPLLTSSRSSCVRSTPRSSRRRGHRSHHKRARGRASPPRATTCCTGSILAPKTGQCCAARRRRQRAQRGLERRERLVARRWRSRRTREPSRMVSLQAIRESTRRRRGRPRARPTGPSWHSRSCVETG